MSRPKTPSELELIFSAHEKRDEERFQEGKESLKESLDDVSTAIQLSSREIMNEVKALGSDVKELKQKVEDLELYRAGRGGIDRTLLYIGAGVASILVGYLGWVALQIMQLNSDVQKFQDTLDSYQITK